MFIGAHMIINSTKPELDRAFLRDVFQLTHIDVGDGWLIFGLPPSEIGIHPSEENDVHELFFMCDNMDDFLKEMKKKKVPCGTVKNVGWGVLSHVRLPGGGILKIYEPRHARPEPMPGHQKPVPKAKKKRAAR